MRSGPFYALAALTLLSACGGVAQSPASDEDDIAAASACTPTARRTREIELAVLPEAGEAPFVDSLHGATKSIRLMVYMLGQDGVFDELVARAHAGVDVRVILDGGAQRAFNQRAFDALGAAGVKVK